MQKIGPHFIVIGAQRSGTTWLHRVLSQHDKLWLTPVKELHYFDKQSIKLGVLNKYERHRAVVMSGMESFFVEPAQAEK